MCRGIFLVQTRLKVCRESKKFGKNYGEDKKANEFFKDTNYKHNIFFPFMQSTVENLCIKFFCNIYRPLIHLVNLYQFE